ncbi:MAG TPA: ABC transporter ATP-binding protein [Gaiellaceae bacterium]|nr:ABC transporter ATP-binding protein [Gaiellaceae bacterium]
MSGPNGGVDVVVEGVSKSFEGGKIVALDGISLRLEPGEFAAVVGPSGCGKSTLLNLMGALDVPDEGTIEVGGADLGHLDDPARYRASTVGFVFQFHYLIATLDARENVQVPMLGHGLGRRERMAKASELLEACAIDHRASAAPSTLSGGERQRVAIARALANDPKLLLADEPTGALDSTTGAQIVELLVRLRDRRGMTIVLVTNDDAVAGAADRTLRIRDGRLEEPAATPAAAPRSA